MGRYTEPGFASLESASTGAKLVFVETYNFSFTFGLRPSFTYLAWSSGLRVAADWSPVGTLSISLR